jgi:hypothetical protein
MHTYTHKEGGRERETIAVFLPIETPSSRQEIVVETKVFTAS